jgi:hypothetical protein
LDPDPDSNRSAAPDSDWVSGIGSRQAKLVSKKVKNEKSLCLKTKEFSVDLEASTKI